MASLEDPPEALTNLEPGALAQVLEAHGRYLARRPGGHRALLGFHDLSERDFGGCSLSRGGFSRPLRHRPRFPPRVLRAGRPFSAPLGVACPNGGDPRPPDLRGPRVPGAQLNK